MFMSALFAPNANDACSFLCHSNHIMDSCIIILAGCNLILVAPLFLSDNILMLLKMLFCSSQLCAVTALQLLQRGKSNDL